MMKAVSKVAAFSQCFKMSRRRMMSSHVVGSTRVTTIGASKEDMMEKASQMMNNTDVWSGKEVSQATHIIRSLLQEPSNLRLKLGSQLLYRCIDEAINQNISSPAIIDTFYRVLRIMKESDKPFISEALKLLNKMDRLPDKSLRPDALSFTMVLGIMAEGDNIDPQLVDDMFRRAQATEGGRNDSRLWHSYLHTLSKCATSDKVEETLKEMISLKITNEYSFTIVLHALAKNGKPERAKAMLERFGELSQLTTTMFNTCIDAFARQGNAVKAQELFRTMKKYRVHPDVFTYGSLINAWAKSSDTDAGERAQQILVEMEANGCAPTSEVLTGAINAWARSKKPWASTKAREILHKMELECQNGNTSVCPSIVTYTSVIHSLANSRSHHADKDAEVLLQRVKDIAASSGRSSFATDRRAFSLNAVVYSAVIDVLAKSSSDDAHTRALALLREMQELAKTLGPNVAPSTVTYNSVISAFAARGDAIFTRMLLREMNMQASNGNIKVEPDEITYSAVLNAYRKWKDPASPEMALQLLDEMQSQYEAGSLKFKPNTIAYTCTILALVHGEPGNAPRQAEAMLHKMQDAFQKGDADLKPNTKTLGAVLQVWATSLEAEAPDRATQLIQWAEQQYKNGNQDIKPNRYCYNYLLSIWAQSGRLEALEQATKIIRGMMQSTDDDVQPDIYSFVQLMTAIKNSNAPDALKQQLEVLLFLMVSYEKGNVQLKPKPIVVHHVISLCRYSRNTYIDEARRTLRTVARLILSSQEWLPNTNTFKYLFDTCLALSIDDAELIKEIYQASKNTKKCTRDVEISYEALLAKNALLEQK